MTGPRTLAPLLGRWRTQMRFPGKTLNGEASFEWLDPEGLMLMRSRTFGEALPPQAVAVIGFDDNSGRWSMAYHDDRGVSRLYAMTFDGRTWTLAARPEGFHQRFEARLEDDAILARWERSDDGETWAEDFAMTYSRSG